MQMWHTESGSHASFAYLISNGHCVRESTWSAEGNWESVWKSLHTRTHQVSRPLWLRFHISLGCCWGCCCMFYFIFFVVSAHSSDCLCFKLLMQTASWAECKQGPKLFTLSRSRWRGWANFFYGGGGLGFAFLFFFYQKLLSVIYRICLNHFCMLILHSLAYGLHLCSKVTCILSKIKWKKS